MTECALLRYNSQCTKMLHTWYCLHCYDMLFRFAALAPILDFTGTVKWAWCYKIINLMSPTMLHCMLKVRCTHPKCCFENLHVIFAVQSWYYLLIAIILNICTAINYYIIWFCKVAGIRILPFSPSLRFWTMWADFRIFWTCRWMSYSALCRISPPWLYFNSI